LPRPDIEPSTPPIPVPNALATIADLNDRRDNLFGQTQLHRAVIGRRVDLVRSLLAEDPLSTTVRDKGGCLPIHYVYRRDERDSENEVQSIARVLLEYGKDLGAGALAPGLDGITPLHLWANSIALLELVLPHCSVSEINIRNGTRDTPLHWALRTSLKESSSRAAIVALIGAGADVNLTNQQEISPFDLAVEFSGLHEPGECPDLELFIDAASTIRRGAKDVFTPFEIFLESARSEISFRSDASLESWANIVKRFVRKEANPDAKMRSGEPLFRACVDGFKHRNSSAEADALLDLILELSTRVNVSTTGLDGNSPLHQVAWSMPFASSSYGSASLTCMKNLLDQGADPNALNMVGAIPLVALLRQGITNASEFESAVYALINAGSDPMQPDYSGDRPLYLVLRAVHEDSLRARLVEKCLDSMIRTRHTRTPCEDVQGTRYDLHDSTWWNTWMTACAEFNSHGWESNNFGMDEILPLNAKDRALLLDLVQSTLIGHCIGKVREDWDGGLISKQRDAVAEMVQMLAEAQYFGLEIKKKWVDDFIDVAGCGFG
jgi:ankyrin repeat protein